MGREPDLYHLPCLHEPFSAVSHLIGAIVFMVLGCRLLQRRKRYLLVRTNFEDDMRSSLLVGMEPEILGAGDLPQ